MMSLHYDVIASLHLDIMMSLWHDIVAILYDIITYDVITSYFDGIMV